MKSKDIIDLEISQLHYSSKVIEYIKVKKKSDVELVHSSLEKNNKKYILSVYYLETIDNRKIYHVCGQEEGSENAFILGALLDDIFVINKISIKGRIHQLTTGEEKSRLELLNLSKMFNSTLTFTKQQKTGEIVPLFSLSGMIARQPLGKITSESENEIENLKRKYEKYGYHDAKCPKGSPFCVHFCNEYDKLVEKCRFVCPFNKEKCDTMCRYYVNSKLVNCLYTKIKIVRQDIGNI